MTRGSVTARTARAQRVARVVSTTTRVIAVLVAMGIGAGITCSVLVLTGNADGGVAHV